MATRPKLSTPCGHVLTINTTKGHYFLAPAPTESIYWAVGPLGQGLHSTASILSMQISIKQHAFSVRQVYSEGTRLTKAEAQALNGLRAENIRNNVFKLVMEAIGQVAPGQVLPASVQAELQEKITEYDLKYQFPLRHEPRGQSPIEAEILVVATERVEANIRQAGVSRAMYESLLAVALADPSVQAEARSRVAMANQAAKRALEDLL